MRKFDYFNKVAIVTGASSGIGREISCMLVKEYGCLVYGIGRDLRKLDEVREELGPNSFLCCAMDVSDKKSWEKLAVSLKSNNVSPDILINCAGFLPRFSSVEKTDVDEYERTLEVNYLSCVYSCKEIMKIMKKGSLIANVSSASALCPFVGTSAYSASKAALQRFSECLALENKDFYVSCLLLGFVKTDIMKNQRVNEKDKKLIDFFSSDVKKVVKKAMKKASKGKKRAVIGFDAHFMSVAYRLFPRLAPKIFSFVIKKANLEMFENIKK